MKPLNHYFIKFALLFLTGFGLTVSCKKDDNPPVKGTAAYSSDVTTSWINMQLKLTRATAGSPLFFGRYFAYVSVAGYESVVPGMSDYKSLVGQLNGLPAMPATTPDVTYNWAISANAALAAMNRNFFPTATTANKASIDSLETANNTLFKQESTTDEINRSVDFGQKVAAVVFEWSKSDGFDNATPYTPPTGAGLWVPTAPAFAKASLPNWGKNRLFVANSSTDAVPGAPTPYSEDTKSAFYAMVKDVYDVNQNLTADQKTIALFWADNADGKSFISGHWFSIFNQVLTKEKPKLDVASMAFAKLGISYADAGITCWQTKYKYSLVRPITYIRDVMKITDWNPYITTPAHPDYVSGHASNSGCANEVLSGIFGTSYQITDHSYDQIGFSPRSYASFDEIAKEAALSRLYGGIHYRASNEAGLALGKKVAQNINATVKFKN